MPLCQKLLPLIFPSAITGWTFQTCLATRLFTIVAVALLSPVPSYRYTAYTSMLLLSLLLLLFFFIKGGYCSYTIIGVNPTQTSHFTYSRHKFPRVHQPMARKRHMKTNTKTSIVARTWTVSVTNKL